MRTRSLSALAAVAALALAGCGDDDDGAAEPSGSAAATVQLTESEFKIEPQELQVTKSGVIEFDVQNTGKITHALEVEGGDVEAETEEIPAGESATLKVELEPGGYELYCPIGDHEEQGMTGRVDVGLPPETEEEGEEGEEGEFEGEEGEFEGEEGDFEGEEEREREEEEESGGGGYGSGY